MRRARARYPDPMDTPPPVTENGKLLAVVSYVSMFVGLPLFLIPLIQKNDAFALQHAKHAAGIFVISLVEAMVFTVFTMVTCGVGALLFPILFVPWIAAAHGVYLALNDRVDEPLLSFGVGPRLLTSIQA